MMDEFMQGNELTVQARRLLGFRVPLVLVILVNAVLLARVPSAAPLHVRQPSAGPTSNASPADDSTSATSATPADRTAVAAANPLAASESTDPPATPSAEPAGATPHDGSSRSIDHGSDSAAGRTWQDIGAIWSQALSIFPDAIVPPATRHTPASTPDQAPSAPQQPTLSAPLPRPAVSDHTPEAATRLTLVNPLENGEAVTLLVDGLLCELKPGMSQQFPAAEQWHIQFHRGGDFGDADRTVRPGRYQFAATAQGWDLQPGP